MAIQLFFACLYFLDVKYEFYSQSDVEMALQDLIKRNHSVTLIPEVSFFSQLPLTCTFFKLALLFVTIVALCFIIIVFL